ncbi:MAG: H/ACA ribonucleoprotein complex subunit NOP10 [Thermoplasmata archaeon]
MTESLLHICRACSTYTLRTECPHGHGPTHTPHPARFSPQDRWAKYRRALMETVATGRSPP